jgi:hypothetical protein
VGTELPQFIYWFTALGSVPVAIVLVAIAVRAKSALGWVAAGAFVAVAAVDVWATFVVNTTPLPPTDCGPAPDLAARPECDYPVRLRQASSFLPLRVFAYLTGIACVLVWLWKLTSRKARVDV